MTALCAAAALYLTALAALIFIAGNRRLFRYYTAAKAVTSGGFLAVALLAFAVGRRALGWRFSLLLGAMALCAAGDVLLGLANNGRGIHSKTFLRGLYCFGGAHLVFCVFYAVLRMPAWWDLLLPLALTGATALLSAKGLLRLHRLRGPALAYSFLVGLMCSMSVGALSAGGPPFAAAGSVLFLLSDCIIVFLYFYIRQRPWMRIANLVTYYLGLLLLGLAAAA